MIAGENGPELIHANSGGYVYNANQTANILSDLAGGGKAQQGAPQSVEVHVVNESGNEVKATNTEAKFDGRKLIITTVLKAIGTNELGSRDFLKGALGNG